MKIVAAYSIKGGVGKTTTAVNLAHEATMAGARVLLWDLDPQGAATFIARVRPSLKAGPLGSQAAAASSAPPFARPTTLRCIWRRRTSPYATSTSTSAKPSIRDGALPCFSSRSRTRMTSC